MAEREITIPWNNEPTKAIVVPIDSIHEQQATYQLSDGSVLMMRTVVMQVLRLKEKWDPAGDPIYLVKSQNIVTTTAPESLRNPPTP